MFQDEDLHQHKGSGDDNVIWDQQSSSTDDDMSKTEPEVGPSQVLLILGIVPAELTICHTTSFTTKIDRKVIGNHQVNGKLLFCQKLR